MIILNVAFVISTLINVCLTQELHELITKKKCREKNRLISTEKFDLYSLVEAPLGGQLMLQCHYW